MEVEAKFRINKDIKEKIEKIAEFVKEVFEEDYYLKHPCRDFMRTDEALRIRKSEKIVLTYKGPKVDRETKTREEIEVVVSDFEGTLEIFKRLGFNVVAKVSKVRKIYKLDDVKILVDSVDGLGDFVEIEIKSDDVEVAKKKIFEIARRLGLKESITKSYLEMLLE